MKYHNNIKPLNIVHIEGNQDDAERIRAKLAQEGLRCILTVVDTEEAFYAALEENSPDLILAEYKMPACDIRKALQYVMSNYQDIPFLIVSNSICDEKGVALLQNGAMDYVLKENLNRLFPVVIKALDRALLLKEKDKALEQALLLSTAIDQVVEAVVITDVSGNIQYVNPSFERISGFSRAEVLGENPRILKSGMQSEKFYRDMWDTLLAGKVWSGRMVNKHKNGSLYTEECNITPVLDNDGRINHYVAVKKDITRSLKMEEQLFLSEKMTTIAGLAAGVAHEINTPLSAILQSVLVVKDSFEEGFHDNSQVAGECGIDLSSVRQYIERKEVDFFLEGIRESALNASRIIVNLLEFSRPQQGEMKMADVNALLDNSLTLAMADYDLKRKYDIINVVIDKQYGFDLPQIECVPMEIEQVFLNLLKNAVQSISESVKTGNGKIVLRTSYEKESFRIEVEDNGNGVDSEIRQYIFDPFFTTKEVGIGTGLGLSVSYMIIHEKHGGRIWLDEGSVSGARFIITLPLVR